MKKDVIYIDNEEDITGIIDKVKHAKAPIVALVPPKRVGVLQSSVNLKLLHRAAEGADKHIVLITSDPALTALASGMSLPIARNLQSKPEIAPLAPLETEETDIIEGKDVPHDNSTIPSNDEKIDSEMSVEAVENNDVTGKEKDPAESTKARPSYGKSIGTKIPNFDIFRKKLFVFGFLGVAATAFLVWALFFAAQAKIAITARTNIVNISKPLQLKPGATLDASQGVLPVTTKQVKKTTAADFQPTGTKQVGEKATGTVKFTPTSANAILNGATIPAGTKLSSGSLGFVTNAAVTIAPTGFSDYLNGKTASATVAITAVAPGTGHNGVVGALTGEPAGVDASLAVATSGGTDKTATVVSADDIAKATNLLKTQDSNTVKEELVKQFSNDEIVISEAYIVESGTVTATPLVDQEATSAKVTVETTYTLLGIKRADLKAVYEAYLTAQLKGDSSQKIYETGDTATQFSSFQKVDGGYAVQAIGSAQVGPSIDSAKIASDAKGKQTGEVIQLIESIQGVENVDVSLSPFWVNRVPNDAQRITVTFVVNNGK